MRILIIEDNKHKLRTVQEILKENELNKYEVTNCGEDAIVKIKQHRINLIILKEGFCWNSNDKTRETYNSQQAYNFLEKMKEYCKKENKRVPLQIDNVYIVKKVEIPISIVECGFLSNPEEEKNLQDDAYQDRLAWGIYNGIMSYFE